MQLNIGKALSVPSVNTVSPRPLDLCYIIFSFLSSPNADKKCHSLKYQRSTTRLLQGQLPCKIYPELLGVLKSTILIDKKGGESHSLHHQPPLCMTILSQVVRNLWPRAILVHAVRGVIADLVEKILGEFIKYCARKRQAQLRWNCVRK